MDLEIFLADSAQIDASGKLHALGLGWTTTTTPTPAMAVVALLRPTFSEIESGSLRAVQVHVDLVDSNDEPVLTDSPEGKVPIQSDNVLLLQRATGAAAVTTVPEGFVSSVPFVVNVGPGMQLEPGVIYKWRLAVDGEAKQAWTAEFLAIPRPQPAQDNEPSPG